MHKTICGIDEVGRGPLAGPVYAAAVMFSEPEIEGVNDSKKLSSVKREQIFNQIISKNVKYAIGISSIQEIEELNILNASHLAMKRALEKLEINPDLILVDGKICPNFLLNCNAKTIIKGDSISYSIACSSIVAKVLRDKFMVDMHKKFNLYGFDKNKGYGTKFHIDSIKKYGPCEIHRMSFLKKYYEYR